MEGVGPLILILILDQRSQLSNQAWNGEQKQLWLRHGSTAQIYGYYLPELAEAGQGKPSKGRACHKK